MVILISIQTFWSEFSNCVPIYNKQTRSQKQTIGTKSNKVIKTTLFLQTKQHFI